MRKLISVAALALALAATTPARADDATDRHDAAIALMNQMHTIDNMTAMIPAILAQVKDAVTRGDPTLSRTFDGFAPKLQADADTEKVSLIEKLAGIYAGTFTADEIKQMAAFYQTPLGQKIVQTQAQVSGDIFRITREWGNGLAQKLAAEAKANLLNDKN